jgi:hypothetical protein
MIIDKWRRHESEIKNLDDCYLNFEGGERPPVALQMQMQHIDLIDWTPIVERLRLDHA